MPIAILQCNLFSFQMLIQIEHLKDNKYKLKIPAILIAAISIIYIYYRYSYKLFMRVNILK